MKVLSYSCPALYLEVRSWQTGLWVISTSYVGTFEDG